MIEELRQKVDALVGALVDELYEQLESDGRAGRLSAEDLRRAVEEYGRELIRLPAEGWELIDEYPQVDTPDRVAIDVPLWTTEEGRSDLTLAIRATRGPGGCLLRINTL